MGPRPVDTRSSRSPNGLAEAFIIGADFVGDDSVALVLGDNIFHGRGFSGLLRRAGANLDGCALFGYRRQATRSATASGRWTPTASSCRSRRSRASRSPTSRSPGLYFYDNEVVDIAKGLTPSARGELEITDVNLTYLDQGRARMHTLGRGFAWLDTGTHDSLAGGQPVRAGAGASQGVRIACLEEVALRMGFITPDECYQLGAKLAKSGYGDYVMSVARDAGASG